jgi:hypothetical protein
MKLNVNRNPRPMLTRPISPPRAMLVVGVGGVAHSMVALVDEGVWAVLTRSVVFLATYWLLTFIMSVLLKRRNVPLDFKTSLSVLAFPQLWYLLGVPGIFTGHCDTFHPLMIFPLLSIVLVHGAMTLALHRATDLGWIPTLKIMAISSIGPLIINVVLVGGMISILGWQPPGDISILC